MTIFSLQKTPDVEPNEIFDPVNGGGDNMHNTFMVDLVLIEYVLVCSSAIW